MSNSITLEKKHYDEIVLHDSEVKHLLLLDGTTIHHLDIVGSGIKELNLEWVTVDIVRTNPDTIILGEENYTNLSNPIKRKLIRKGLGCRFNMFKVYYKNLWRTDRTAVIVSSVAGSLVLSLFGLFIGTVL